MILSGPVILKNGQPTIMLQTIKSYYGKKLQASDGEIGHVLDFYFDDQTWAVRYVVADTGSWLSGRQVLLSPRAFGTLHEAGQPLVVNLTREQIQNSPAIESQMPVSRQYEEEYHRYYGWPSYLEVGGVVGTIPVPMVQLAPQSLPAEPAPAGQSLPESADPHLRSALALDGYHLQASDAKIGHVFDFMIDTQTWAIRQLVIKTGQWLPGHEVEIETGQVDRISYDESTVYIKLTEEAVKQSHLHLTPT